MFHGKHRSDTSTAINDQVSEVTWSPLAHGWITIAKTQCVSYSSSLNWQDCRNIFQRQVLYHPALVAPLIQAVCNNDLWAPPGQWAHCLTSGIWHSEWLVQWWSGVVFGWTNGNGSGVETLMCNLLLWWHLETSYYRKMTVNLHQRGSRVKKWSSGSIEAIIDS